MEVEINRIFTDLKNKRLLELRKSRRRQTVDALGKIHARCVAGRPVDEPQPTVGDLFHIDTVRKTCMQYAQDSGDFSDTLLHFVLDNFLLYREEWIGHCRRTLLALAEKSEQKSSDASQIEITKVLPGDDALTAKPTTSTEDGAALVDKLQLVTTFFECRRCRTHLRFPNVLMHACARYANVGCTGEEQSDWVADAFSDYSMYRYEGRLNIHSDRSRGYITTAGGIQMANVLAVLDILGLDPATTTVDQLNDMDPILECLSCNTLSKGRCVMDWEAVVSLLLSFFGLNYSCTPGSP